MATTKRNHSLKQTVTTKTNKKPIKGKKRTKSRLPKKKIKLTKDKLEKLSELYKDYNLFKKFLKKDLEEGKKDGIYYEYRTDDDSECALACWVKYDLLRQIYGPEYYSLPKHKKDEDGEEYVNEKWADFVEDFRVDEFGNITYKYEKVVKASHWHQKYTEYEQAQVHSSIFTPIDALWLLRVVVEDKLGGKFYE